MTNIDSNPEKIGVIGSPSSTGNLTIDILGIAADKRLVGNLSFFNYTQDGKNHYALGQITEIQLRNIWTEDPTMRGLIRQKERVDPITERQDTHTAKMMISAVFSHENGIFKPSILGTVPSTGTTVNLMNETIMNNLLQKYQKDLFYLGKVYASTTGVKMPMWFRHFGDVATGGAGEAYHIGIFGKTGSGKSILSFTIVMGYARHRGMSILIFDPQGQFTKEFQKDDIRKRMANSLKRNVELINLFNLILTGPALFHKILINSDFLKRRCNIISIENQLRAVNQIQNILHGKIGGQRHITNAYQSFKPWHYFTREAFDQVWESILTNEHIQKRIYTSEESRETMIQAMQLGNKDEVYEEWKKITNLFSYNGKENPKKIKDIISEITSEKSTEGKILVIDLAETSIPETIFWNEQMRYVVIEEFLSQLNKEAELLYKNDKLLNTLVVLDEAHRLAPRDRTDNEQQEQLKRLLKDAIRTTRKYGLGWMFISQTLSSLDREIINQIRIYIFGYGLGWGIERQALREIIGGAEESIRLYQNFNDPQSSLEFPEYSFMTIGPISPLSFSGSPLFFTGFQYPGEFLEVNFGKDVS